MRNIIFIPDGQEPRGKLINKVESGGWYDLNPTTNPVVEIGKAIFHPASDELISERRSICKECDQKNSILGIPYCGICHCILDAKIRVTTQRCPADKW